MSIIRPGGCYYFFTHAYHHLIAELVEITGKREGDIRRVIRIQSSQLSWTRFFLTPLDPHVTVYTHFPEGNISWFAAFRWPHPIPENTDAPARRRG